MNIRIRSSQFLDDLVFFSFTLKHPPSSFSAASQLGWIPSLKMQMYQFSFSLGGRAMCWQNAQNSLMVEKSNAGWRVSLYYLVLSRVCTQVTNLWGSSRSFSMPSFNIIYKPLSFGIQTIQLLGYNQLQQTVALENMDTNSESLLGVSRLEIAPTLNRDNSHNGKFTDRRSLGNRGHYKNLNIKGADTVEEKVKMIEERVGALERKIEQVIISLDRLRDQKTPSHDGKMVELANKCEKIEYFVWESKQIEKQHRAMIQEISAKMLDNKLAVDKNVNLLKTNNHLLLSTVESGLEQLIQRVENNKAETARQFRKMCQAMEEICAVQTKMESWKPTVSVIKENHPVIREEIPSVICETLNARRSLPLRHSMGVNPRKTISSKKKEVRNRLSLL